MEFLNGMFPEQKPLFALIADKYGYGEILDQLLNKAFTKGEEIKDLRVIQAILLIASTRCNSNYCYVFHSLILNSLETTPDQIKHITDYREFPDSLPELKKYNEFLSIAYFRKSVYSNDDYSYISDDYFLNESPAIRDLLSILIVSDFLLMLTVAFSKEVNLEEETLFETFPSQIHIPDYIKYFAVHKSESQLLESPVFTICTHCKSIKNQKKLNWEPVEKMISVLPKDARFSHGFCDLCAEKIKASLGLN